MVKQLLFIVSFGMLVFACGKEPDNGQLQEVKVLSGNYSDCLGTTKSLNLAEEESYVIRAIGGSNYLIEHKNASFNCCLPEGIAFSASTGSDTIFFTDYEKIAGNCRCICKYNTNAEIGEIEEGSYLLYLTTGETFVGSVQLNFKPDMYVEIPVSDLAESS